MDAKSFLKRKYLLLIRIVQKYFINIINIEFDFEIIEDKYICILLVLHACICSGVLTKGYSILLDHD